MFKGLHDDITDEEFQEHFKTLDNTASFPLPSH